MSSVLEPLDSELLWSLRKLGTAGQHPFDWHALSETQCSAISQLVDAGLVELLIRAVMTMPGHPGRVETVAWVSGEYVLELMGKMMREVPSWLSMKNGRVSAVAFPDIQIDYVGDPEFTDDGELAQVYMCSGRKDDALQLARQRAKSAVRIESQSVEQPHIEASPESWSVDRPRRQVEQIIVDLLERKVQADEERNQLERERLRREDAAEDRRRVEAMAAKTIDEGSEATGPPIDPTAAMPRRACGASTDGGRESGPAGESIVDDAWMTHTDIAKYHKVNPEALRKRLDRYRKQNLNGWREADGARPNEPRYLYHYGTVKGVAAALQASGETSGKRPAE